MLIKKKKKKRQIFARQRNGNGALQVAAFSRSLPSLSEGRRAPLNLIDETVLVEDYPSVFSANFPLPPRIEKRDDSSQILRRIPFEVHVSRNACGTSEKGEGNCRLQQMSGNFEASRGTRRGNDRLSANFNQQDPRTFRRKRSKRLAVKFNPLLGFTIDLSKESSVGRTLSNPAIDSDNIIGPMRRVFSKS